MPDKPKTLVLGLGNILMQDEGVGVHAVRVLAAALPTSVICLDGGTLGLELMPHIKDCDHLLVLDAMQTGRAPGTVVRLDRSQVFNPQDHKMSFHEVGLQDLLIACLLTGHLPVKFAAWGIEPQSLDWSLELSTPVQAALPALLDAAVGELRQWGVMVQ